ncbi:MAG: hypothetical protein KFF77_06120 [Bacteroidetes bacterium]|nr:hypothetical protein [Bacteroidota bacterium]
MTGPSHVAKSWDDRILRTAIMFLVFAGALWLGGSVYRAMIANELFIAGSLEFDPNIRPAQEQTLYQLIFASSIVVLISYAVTLISAIIVLWRIPLKIKENGWLLMASLLVFVFVPVEIFTAWLDIHFFWLWDWTTDTVAAQGPQAFLDVQTELRKTISHRIGALAGLPVMAALCYITAAIVVIWQPMRRNTETEVHHDTETE